MASANPFDQLDDLVAAVKAKGVWLNRFESIVRAYVAVAGISGNTVKCKDEVLECLAGALRLHLAKEKLLNGESS